MARRLFMTMVAIFLFLPLFVLRRVFYFYCVKFIGSRFGGGFCMMLFSIWVFRCIRCGETLHVMHWKGGLCASFTWHTI